MGKRALVVGASGLVGSRLVSALEVAGWEVAGTFMQEPRPRLIQLDIRDREAVARVAGDSKPDVVFLPAAYSNVDGCEDNPELAQAVNVAGTQNVLAEFPDDVLVVFYSSDYVFDGATGPYSEVEPTTPVSTYGTTKVLAEKLVMQRPKHLIIRTTWVFGWDANSKNFAMQVWRRLSAQEEMRVAVDQLGTPTLAEYLAEVSVRLVETAFLGTVNVVGGDRLSRSQFARRLARAFSLSPNLIRDVQTSELDQRASRPLLAGLKTDLLQSTLGTEPMALDEALKRIRRQWRASTYKAAGPGGHSSNSDVLKREILEKVREYYELAHTRPPFAPFETRVNYAGRVYGHQELVNLVDASLDFWLTLGPWGDVFERSLRQRLGTRDVVFVNSGSSANLAAVTALTSPYLDEPLRPGDEVITAAVTFPTTLAPLLQNRLVPVVVDCELGSYNVALDLVEDAITKRTRAIMVPHTLGNPVALDRLVEIASTHKLYLIEDGCDALGSKYDGRPVGTFGDLSTISFYPAHHITTGEGGAVVVNRAKLARIVRSIRDWGRDCWCAPGESNTCGKRFGWQVGGLPEGYDHKYIYSHVGYNLKPTDLQAAIGVAQLDRLDDFVAARRRNFDQLNAGLQRFQDRLILPRWEAKAEPAWFGFPVTVRLPGLRRPLVQWLEEANIETRDLFGGHVLHQPAFMDAGVKVHGELPASETVMNQTFFIGVYPGLSPEAIEFTISRFETYFRNH